MGMQDSQVWYPVWKKYSRVSWFPRMKIDSFSFLQHFHGKGMFLKKIKRQNYPIINHHHHQFGIDDTKPPPWLPLPLPFAKPLLLVNGPPLPADRPLLMDAGPQLTAIKPPTLADEPPTQVARPLRPADSPWPTLPLPFVKGIFKYTYIYSQECHCQPNIEMFIPGHILSDF